MLLDILGSLLIISLCYWGKRLDEELEIRRLIKEGKEMEKETVIDVEYEIIIDYRSSL